MAPQITLRSWIMVGLLGLVWGATFMGIEIALRGITPFWLAAGRIAFAAVLTVAVWRARGGALFAARPAPHDWRRMVSIGLLSSAVPFMLLSWGQQYVNSGFAGVSMAAVALMVLPLAHFMVPGEHMRPRTLTGFVIGFIGVLVLIGAQAFASTGESLENLGRLTCLAAAACYAFSSVEMRLLPAVDAVGLSAVSLIIGAVFVGTAALIVEGAPPMPDLQTLGAIAVLGLIPTAGANLLRVLVIRSAGPTFMTLTNYQVPVWSVIFGTNLLGEAFPPSLFWALLLILGGLAISQWDALRRVFSPARR
jgi:drug/metabolite transporter (DMT)-like permease